MQSRFDAVQGKNHRRTVFLIVAKVEQDAVTIGFRLGLGKIPGEIKNLLKVASYMHIPGAPEQPGVVLAAIPQNPADEKFFLFDWDVELLDPQMGTVEVPKPGVIIALYGPNLDMTAAILAAIHIKSQISVAPDVLAYLNSPEAGFSPVRYASNDFFLSYTAEDTELATELKNSLEAKGARVFLAAKSISLGDRWEPEIRNALRSSSIVIVLVTPSSVDKPWVIFEGGAAWALDIPVAIALSHIKPLSLPAALSAYQSKPFETQAQRDLFVSELLGKLSSIK